MLHSLAVPEQYHHFFPVGYHNMCRFYGGFAYSHPALKDFDYFWRLDSNVKYLCVPPFDPAQYMIENELDYGRSSFLGSNMKLKRGRRLHPCRARRRGYA